MSLWRPSGFRTRPYLVYSVYFSSGEYSGAAGCGTRAYADDVNIIFEINAVSINDCAVRRDAMALKDWYI